MSYTAGGYTVLEVMIFLAISAFLLIFTIPAISGQQSRTYFTQGVRDLDSKLQDVINDVSTGYFDNSSRLACNINGAGTPVLSAGPSNVGTNQDCMLIGKIIHASTHANVAPPPNESISIYSVVGARTTRVAGQPVTITSLLNTQPITSNQLQEVYPLKNGIKIVQSSSRQFLGDALHFHHQALGIFTNFNGDTGTIGATGQRTQNLVPYFLRDSHTSNLNIPSCVGASLFRSPNTDPCSERPFYEWNICVSDNADKYDAMITLRSGATGLASSINFEVSC